MTQAQSMHSLTVFQILFIGSDAQRQRINIKLNALAFNLTNQVKNLRVIFDSDLSFNPHRNITKAAFYHLKNLPH